MISFKEITKENWWQVAKLKVKKHQEDQVDNNAVSIAQFQFYEDAWMRGVYVEDKPVGFVMLSIEADKNEFDVWKFMIDQNEQGKGYGKAALIKAVEYIKQNHPRAKEVGLSYVPKENDGADGFYKKVGFIDTGEWNDRKTEKVMKFIY